MAAQSKGNPDYVPASYCNRLHDMQEKRLDRIEQNQEKTAERLNEIHSMLKNGIKTEITANASRIADMMKTHKWILKSFVGLLIAIIVNVVIMLIK